MKDVFYAIAGAAAVMLVAACIGGCAITINTAKEGETANQSAAPTISPAVTIEMPRSE